MDKIDSIFRIIDRYDHYIELANNKANFILASTISINLAIAALIGYADILKFEINSPSTNILKIIVIICYAIFLIFNLLVLFGVHKVILPNTNTPKTEKPSNIFFGDVASRDHLEYADAVKGLNSCGLLEDLSFQANTLAVILNEKFKHQKRIMEITLKQVAPLAFVISSLCGIIKAFS